MWWLDLFNCNLYCQPTFLQEFKERKRRAQEAEDQFRKILEMERYKGLCAQLRIEKSWSIVFQIEAVVAELSSKVAQIESKIEGIEGEQTQLEESKANMVSSHEYAHKFQLLGLINAFV